MSPTPIAPGPRGDPAHAAAERGPESRIGHAAVRRQMLQTVLEFEQEFVRQHGDDPKLRREQADAQFDPPRFASEIGTNGDALTAYRRAADLYRELHEGDPRDVELQRCYVNSLNNAGVHESDVESKRADFQETRRLYEEFLCFQPDDERLLCGLGGALDNIGSSYLNSGRFREAMDCLNQAVAIQEELLAPRRPPHRLHQRPGDDSFQPRRPVHAVARKVRRLRSQLPEIPRPVR